MSARVAARAGVAVAALLWARAGAGAEGAPPADDTFRYQEPQESHRLRAVGEVGLYLGLQLSSYLVRPSPSAVGGAPRSFGPLAKLRGEALTLDANSFGTNFVGHPVMGATLHQLARGNRLAAWESALWTVLGSATWELVEYREKASINDLLVTPVAGVALGEPLFQLGAHLDRSPRTTGRVALAWLVSPWKKLHDLVDGARPERGGPGDELGHRLAAGAGVVAGRWRRSEVSLAAAWRLARDGDGPPAGGGWRWLLDGRLTGLSVGAALAPERLADLRLDSWVLLAALSAGPADPGGGSLVIGAGLAFDTWLHAWERSGPTDALALVHLPRLSARAEGSAGPLRIEARLAAGLAFGGARSLALDGAPEALPAAALPSVQRGFGYHFALGPRLTPGLAVRWGRLSVGGAWDWVRLSAVLRPDPTPGVRPEGRLDDRWSEWSARATLRLWGPLEVGATAAHRARWSRAGARVREATERGLGLTVALVEEPGGR